MIALWSGIVLVALLILCILFILTTYRQRGKTGIFALIFAIFYLLLSIWIIAIMLMQWAGFEHPNVLWALDSVTNISSSLTPVLLVYATSAFFWRWKKIPPMMYLLLIVPVITILVVWTNPLHHLMYVQFSIIRSEIIFGPYMYVAGVYSYLCNLIGIVQIIQFMIVSEEGLYRKQGLVILSGYLVPMIVSVIATLGIVNLSIAATPMAFMVTALSSYLATYKLHIADVRPLATQHLMDQISDGYLVVNAKGLIVSCNQSLQKILGQKVLFRSNAYLKDCYKIGDVESKSIVYDMQASIDTSRRDFTTVSYELAVLATQDAGLQKVYYLVQCIPLSCEGEYAGSVVVVKDITEDKQRLEEAKKSQQRMMERERLAFMGQLSGGFAHNLKTPIMSVTGCAIEIERLIQECQESLGDPEVLEEDYREIYGEMENWVQKIRESCSYMSEIITAVKGQSSTAIGNENMIFTVRELFKRSILLMQHEAKRNGCRLSYIQPTEKEYRLQGDLNVLLQAINNLVDNAIDAVASSEGKKVVLVVEEAEEALRLYVKDNGPGFPDHIKNKLFKEMVTSKGTRGTGLGLYISSMAVNSGFEGTMWAKNHEDGGACVGIDIPLRWVSIVKHGEEGMKA